ncbi:MAG: UDP-N-acetylmuramoyl-L-alanine--D-glutamate ligase [Candidatus Omnitrophota bacterium]
MRNREFFKNKKVTVIGLARSGSSCVNLLHELGAEVSVSDAARNPSTVENSLGIKSKEIKVELGGHTPSFIKGRDLVVLSPGVAFDAPPVTWAKDYGIPLIGEIELSWILCPATIIAVTGSCGKTTVTTLLGRALEAAGKKAFVCGNIGKPFSQEVSKMQEGDFVCLEVSSFQLEAIQDFKPKAALILNISPNHLDRYKNMQEYIDAKKRIFMNQDNSDFLVLNKEDPCVSKFAQETKARVLYFKSEKGLNPNQAAVISAVTALGIERAFAQEAFKNFTGIEHRLEFAGRVNNIKFINDSKATTVDSCLWALRNVSEPVVLIAGGKDKGVDYSAILAAAKGKIREVVLIGQAREKIRQALKGSLPVQEAPTLEEAVKIAYRNSRPGDCVLLSPMCSSFDMFSNYEERGECFKRAVGELMRDTNDP